MRTILFIMALLAFGAPAARADAPIGFSIERGGEPIGHHRVTFERAANGDLIANVDIAIQVRIAFITVFRYSHRARETWRDGRLVALDARTDDDGRRSVVRARATAEGLEIDGPEGRFVAPADILPTSYWRRDTVQRRQLLDTQAGRIVDVAVRRVGEGQWRISGDLDFTIGYAPDGAWSGMSFTVRGASITYAPGPPRPVN